MGGLIEGIRLICTSSLTDHKQSAKDLISAIIHPGLTAANQLCCKYRNDHASQVHVTVRIAGMIYTPPFSATTRNNRILRVRGMETRTEKGRIPGAHRSPIRFLVTTALSKVFQIARFLTHRFFL